MNLEEKDFLRVVADEKVNHLFPIFLKLENVQTLVIGAGQVGLEKTRALINNCPQANVNIVALHVNEDLKELINGFPTYKLHHRAFEESDLENVQLVISASNNEGLNTSLKKLAHTRGILLNVADKPEQCDFYLSSIATKGQIKIAISTNGLSPTLAKRMREVFEEEIPEEVTPLAENLYSLRKRLRGDFTTKVRRLNKLTRTLSENGWEREMHWKRIATISIVAFSLMLAGHLILSNIPLRELFHYLKEEYQSLNLGPDFHWFALAGFAAQLVDGALGMGYGLTTTTVLLSLGLNPAAISGSVHTAEIFTSGASGYSHYRFGNVNKKLFKALLIPGVIGAILGALLLIYLGNEFQNIIRPIMAMYTMFLGLRIFYLGVVNKKPEGGFKHYGWLAGGGAFLDSFGGGGWGPIVTSTLVSKGRSPRYVIGSVSLTEFFITLASAFTFFSLIGITHWQVIVALVIGGLLAAPLAAKLAGRIPRRASFFLLGVLIILWSLKILINLLK